jgi:hypothetical protein
MRVVVVNDVEMFDGGIEVTSPAGKFKQIATPTGFTDLAFRNAVMAFDTYYRVGGAVPNIDDLAKFLPSMEKRKISALFLTDAFKEALEYRGISFDPEKHILTMEQQTTLLKLSDPFDKRALSTKLKELGVPMPRFQAWLKQPLFFEIYNKHSQNAYREALPALRNRLISNAESGDHKAIELVFAITNEWNPAQQSLEDARVIIMKIVEAITTHVKDPEVRKAILTDISLYASTIGEVGSPKTLEA